MAKTLMQEIREYKKIPAPPPLPPLPRNFYFPIQGRRAPAPSPAPPPPPPPLPPPRTLHFLPPASGIIDKKMIRKKYKPLYEAALKGDWKKALEIFREDYDAIKAGLTMFSATVLHVAASAGHSEFVEKLVDRMPPEALALKETNNGDTGLHSVAITGQTKAAMAMVGKNSNLTHIPNKKGWIPLLSAIYGSSKQQKEMIEFLYTATISTRDSINGNPLISPFQGPAGGELICTLIRAGYYDIAMSLIKSFPRLATQRDEVGACALEVLGEMPYAFRSGTQLGVWQRCIYSLIPMELPASHQNHAIKVDTENPQDNLENVPTKVKGLMTKFLHVTNLNQVPRWMKLKELLLKVPCIKKVCDEKMNHKKALDLVTFICAQIKKMSSRETSKFFKESSIFTIATKYGTVDLIEKCIEKFPDLIWFKMKDGRNIFEVAIEERHEKIFKLVNEINKHKKDLVYLRDDESGNNILHLAAKLSPSSLLQPIYCEALEMQIELQWYKVVENIALPIHKLLRNNEGKTPSALFTKEHKVLMDKAENWMKKTANSCMLAATLIATVVFAAAFTVPGGNFSDNNSTNDKGIPILLYKNSFILFVVADALSLFSSSTSVLMFLSILNSRYAAEDFLKSLPKKLIIGLATLFISIATMMVAFSATLYIAVAPRFGWVPIIPLVVLASATVVSFLSLQTPLFLEMVYTTYWRRSFYKSCA